MASRMVVSRCVLIEGEGERPALVCEISPFGRCMRRVCAKRGKEGKEWLKGWFAVKGEGEGRRAVVVLEMKTGSTRPS